MLPKNFFENHFTGEIKNEFFVALASDNSYNKKLSALEKAASNLEPKLKVVSIQQDSEIDDITYKIFNAISHSKLLLFDLSDDERLTIELENKKTTKEINANVMYELGVALTFRDKSEIILVRKKSERGFEELPFDIKNIGIISYENESEIEKIIFKKAQEKLERKKEIVEGIAHSFDDIAYYLIKTSILNRAGNLRHFNIQDETENLQKFPTLQVSKEQVRLSVLKLLDLGLIKLEAYEGRPGAGAAYHWTDLGKNILDFIEKNKGNQSLA